MPDVPAPQRLAVKLFARPDPGEALALEPFIPLFHRFIQEKTLEGLLLDVADYAHVPNGPGILLVGHDVDYAIDRAGGRTGLLTVCKRCAGLPLSEVLRDALRRAFGAAHAIEASGVSALRFDPGRLEVQLLDRLATPNGDAAFEAARSAAAPVLAGLYAPAACEIARPAGADPREPLTLRVTASDEPDPARLRERLGGGVADPRR